MAKLALALLIVCSGVGCIGAEPMVSEPDVGGMYDPEPAPLQPTSKPVAEAAPEQSKPVETTSQPAVQPPPVAKQAPVKAEPAAAAPPVVEPAAQPEQAAQPEPEVAPEPTPAPEMTPPVVPAPVQPAPELAPVTPIIVPAPVVPVVPTTPAVCQPDVCEDPRYSCTPPQTGALDEGHTDAGSWARTYTLDSVTDMDLISLPFMMRKSSTLTAKIETDLPPGDAYFRCAGDSYDDGHTCGAGTGWVLHKGCLIIASEFTVTCRVTPPAISFGSLFLLFHQPPTDGELKVASRCEYNVAVSWH